MPGRSSRAGALALLLLLPAACWEAGGSGLVEAALSNNAKTRQKALVQLRRGDHQHLVPAFLQRLGEEEAALVMRAVDALEAVGDPGAVEPLIELSRLTDPSFTPRIVQVIGVLGGRQAQAYLFTLESGSPEAAVREAAAEARRDLEARIDGPPEQQELGG